MTLGLELQPRELNSRKAQMLGCARDSRDQENGRDSGEVAMPVGRSRNPRKPAMMSVFSFKRLWLVGLSAILVTSGLALRLYRLDEANGSPTPEPAPWALQTAKVERGSVARSIQSAAVIVAPQSIVLSPQIQGAALTVGPRAGAAVERGDLLVRIDARSILSNIAALEQQRVAAVANADYAAKQQARSEALVAASVVSRSVDDQARAAAQAARAQVEALSQQIAALQVSLGYAEIRAPQDAIVAERLVQAGDTVGPGSPVYRLTAGTGAVVQVSLPASELALVHVGDMLQLTQNGVVVRLPISRVGPAVNAAGLGTVEADAPVAPFNLPSGSSVAVTVLTAPTGNEALTVPASAVIGAGSNAHVVLFTPGPTPDAPGRLHLARVEVLQQGGLRVAIRGELQPDELVAVGQTAVLAQVREGDAAVTDANPGAAE
ncbi:MAG: efflux RND transporter periplasmic adaptor subunit [Ancalomicrobiaceae bacterium]|nr:efflux RND transporter periplasmic adaptor subunit [Ancalomicrobiaceae bacterium]